MSCPPTKRYGEVESQPSGLYPGSCAYENMNPVVMAQYMDTFHNMYVSAVPANTGNYNIPLTSHLWLAEIPAALDTPVADLVTSPTTPTHYMPVPIPTPFFGVAPLTPDEGQDQTDPFAYGSPCTAWWLASPNGAGSSNLPMTPATSFEDTISNFQRPRTASTTFANLATDLSQLEILPGLRHDGLPRRTSTCLDAGPGEAATDLEGSAPGPALSPTRDTDPPRGQTAPAPGAGPSAPGGASGRASLGRPATSSPTGASPGTRARRASPAAAMSRAEKRPRNRAAALKCRARTKASVEALKASEKTESRRRAGLLAALRALQAEVLALKGEILLHARCGDPLIDEYLDGAARSFVPGFGGGGAEFAPGEGGWWVPGWPDVVPPPPSL